MLFGNAFAFPGPWVKIDGSRHPQMQFRQEPANMLIWKIRQEYIYRRHIHNKMQKFSIGVPIAPEIGLARFDPGGRWSSDGQRLNIGARLEPQEKVRDLDETKKFCWDQEGCETETVHCNLNRLSCFKFVHYHSRNSCWRCLRNCRIPGFSSTASWDILVCHHDPRDISASSCFPEFSGCKTWRLD